MKILITGAESRLGQAIASGLPDHELRLWGAGDPPDPEAEWFRGDMRDPDVAWQAVRGVDAVVHTGEPPSGLPEDALEREQELLDLSTRGTHVLFSAGVEAGVKRFVYGSTLEVFEAYPDDVYITEMWRPMPLPEMGQMTRYLGELVCREFAREFQVTVTALRLGKLVSEDEVAEQDPDLMWLDYRDAVQAFRLALNRESSRHTWVTRRFALYHVCAAIPNPKYLVGKARGSEMNGFQAEHNFEAHWSEGGSV